METKQENVIPTDYAEVMQKSYIDYAMSVIISRALPDVRDGLKPVQRRTLYDMYELGIRYDRPYRKCARIVGDTMGKYHPHGDSSIYEALVVMAQDFKKGRTLVDGHGNFGSIEGDGAAAMRYTEARLEKLTQDVFLEDLDKNVVDFMPNFDETEKEPVVLPVRIPNLLVNGADGIAVGMATSIPPHNLGEVVDAVKAYMKNNDISVKGLMRYLKGPDFPTGGLVVNKDDLLKIYETGTGKLRVRGKVETVKLKGGRQQLVITEIPYTMIGANIGKFLNDIASLVENKKTTDIVDISNQSSKEGIRIVLDLKRDADVENLTNMLYKKTKLEDTFGVNMLAVADGRPETLSLKQVIEHHVDFVFDITTRKYTTLLNKEQEKKEIQEGLIKACDVIDLIIEILRGSKSREQVKKCLVDGATEGIRFKSKSSEKAAQKLRFSEKQAAAILDMRLYKLIGLEIEALQADYAETMKNIARYEDILNNYDSMAEVIMKDLDQIKKEYGTRRRTVIENAEEVVYEEKKMEEMEVTFLMDRFGYMRIIDKSAYERNKEAANAENKYVFNCMNTDKICIFTDNGKMHSIKVADIPLVRFRDKGTPADNLSNYDSARERMLYVAPLAAVKESTLLFVTASSMCKLVAGEEFDVAKRTIASTKLTEGDELIFVGASDEMEQIVLQSEGGYFLRFQKQDVSTVKKTSIGVRGMKLAEGDRLAHAYLLESRQEYTITHHDKPYTLNKIKLAKRDSKGTKPRI
ncbi:DNA gyrase subunit A [Blautia luti]|uniref:DNA topoisomerase (ATP-hydrolyzing) n=1 Tax=Blautia luti DSM 14534 = JCM 17040 TaxID=649762 RepID=A0A844GE11_9FIRM|nr:DNA topoisomerase (ATP-hydrolyzing) [Blautia luti]MTD60276.1 DNA topoisomerase 4 subunit A [Blautia luti DSM 14534 = JCM 17040]RHQ93787.1 DNA topoisomerase 4 subunit A [Ruminococcus sp. AF21-42]BEI59902.1 DNA gyrase subunit A [Blautia luti]